MYVCSVIALITIVMFIRIVENFKCNNSNHNKFQQNRIPHLVNPVMRRYGIGASYEYENE